uniref:Uncharacterized protein n=1 Tax=Panagrolaimus superbus TaxID=310955 RepID=A0A914XX05_9BILA
MDSNTLLSLEQLKGINNRRLYAYLNSSDELFDKWLRELKVLHPLEKVCEKCEGKMVIRDRGAKESDEGKTISLGTLVTWKQYFRDLCSEDLDANPIIIGGPGIEVQIDETVITKRKYNRGRMPADEIWFFGGVEPVSGRAFMTAVRSRDRETLYDVMLMDGQLMRLLVN